MKISRLIERKLAEWKSQENRKPIILRGARQVGKTFTINEFSKQFKNFISLNLERPRERELFTRFNSGKELFENILLYKGTKVPKEETLLFIDEIQNSADAIRSLRYFYEELSGLSIIAAGSLLEVFSKKEGFSFPVGRVINLFLYPVNFLEYLEAANPPLAQKMLIYNIRDKIPSEIHQLLMDQFYRYSFIGGMPGAVSEYLENESYSEITEIYDSIFRGYLEDVEKYSSLARAKYLSHAIDRAPLYVGERIKYEKFGESLYRSREMNEAFSTLEKALILYRAKPTSSFKLPIIENLKKAPKLFFVDSGLVNFRIGLKEFFKSSQSLNDIYRGKIADQVVSQEIISQSFELPRLSFWIREKGESEIDFLYAFKDLVIPVEIKSGKVGRMKSLMLFMEKSIHPYSIRVYSGEMQVDKIPMASGKYFYLLSMPFYLLARLQEILQQFIDQFK